MKRKADNGFTHASTDMFFLLGGETQLLKVLAMNSQNGHLQHIHLRGYVVVTYCTS